MKTSVNMIRQMGNFEVIQRTSDSMFNATKLLSDWNNRHGMKKEVKDFFVLKQTKEFLDTLESELSQHGGDSPYVKSRASKGKNAGTWMHPYLFMKFAMWINPKFELTVIKFVYDQLIEYRNTAGDMYVGLSSALAKFKNVNYSQVGKGLNHIVFGEHKKERRNSGTPEQLRELSELERNLAFSIDMGLIKSYNGFLEVLRNKYRAKYSTPF